jgi:16S rRNA (uracil1498-N3)-methyltransferase
LVFVADLVAPVLSDEDRHHLARVLRLRSGDPLTVADGSGAWRTAAFADAIAVTGEVVTTAAPVPPLAVGFALVKGDKPEWVVQKLTELGIDRIIPFRADRSVVRWDAAKAERAVQRLRSVARAAAMQCHRPTLPEVIDVAELGQLAAQPGVAFTDRGGEALTSSTTTLLVGPEGGWSSVERDLAPAMVALGGHVLRAETAAITAGALLAALRGGVVGFPR